MFIEITIKHQLEIHFDSMCYFSFILKSIIDLEGNFRRYIKAPTGTLSCIFKCAGQPSLKPDGKSKTRSPCTRV